MEPAALGRGRGCRGRGSGEAEAAAARLGAGDEDPGEDDVQQRPATAHVHGPREDEQDVEEGSRGDGRGRDEVNDGLDGG